MKKSAKVTCIFVVEDRTLVYEHPSLEYDTSFLIPALLTELGFTVKIPTHTIKSAMKKKK